MLLPAIAALERTTATHVVMIASGKVVYSTTTLITQQRARLA
jgi:hypothetical protein